MYGAAVADREPLEPLEPPAGLLDRLRQLDGYTWDETVTPFHSSYDIWHVFGIKHKSTSTNSTPTPPISPGSESPHFRYSSNDRSISARYSRTNSDSSIGDPQKGKERQDIGDRKKRPQLVGDVEVIARVSVHPLRDERVYYIVKNLVSTVDPNGDHFIRPVTIKRLPSQHGDEGPLIVCIFEFAGPNYLWKLIDFGPAWYNLYGKDLRGPSSGLRNRTFVAEPMSLQMFLNFAIGAAECIELLHGAQIVHGEIRGDAFHMNMDTGRIKLLNIGAGLRTFEHGLTSTGWTTMSRELGAKTKLSFMSPEQTGRMPAEPDSRSDIFSLGVLFWTLLTQKPAFEGETPMDVIQAVLGRRLPLVSNLRLGIPEVVGRIIQKATAKLVSERYFSMSGLRHDLVEVRRMLGAGDSAQLVNWEIATKDVSPFFILPEVMVGRNAEHDTVVKIIDHAFKSHQASRRHGRRGTNHLSRLSEGHFASFDMASGEGEFSIDDIESSGDGRTNSLSMSDAAAASAETGTYTANTSKLRSHIDPYHNPVDIAGSIAGLSDSSSPQKWMSGTHESVAGDSMNSEVGGPRSSIDGTGNMSMNRNSRSFRGRGRCEIITIAGESGLGKSRLLGSIQVEARQRGYFASSKFGQEKTPFGPVLKLLSSLFQQVFSESNMDLDFHQILKQHVAPMWPILHKVLSLPEFLLGPRLPIRAPSKSRKLSRVYNKPLMAEVIGPTLSPTSSHSSLSSKTLGAQSTQDFLRAGSSTKTLPLMNTFLDILRIFTRHKFICFCLDDLQFADEESFELLAQIVSTRIKMVIIMAYRPEEVSPEVMKNILNPFHNEEKRKVGDLGVTPITLKPLNEDDIMTYVSATLRRPKAEIFPLGAVVQSKTAGNPFYIREMLVAGHRKNCIWYDYRESRWLYDLDRIFTEFQTDDYNDTLREDFITNRLNELPATSRSILAWASMLGTSFSFKLIQRLLSGEFTSAAADIQDGKRIPPSYSEQDSVTGLQVAIQSYMIVSTQDDDIFSFAHDRYVHAAASLRGDEPLMHFIISQTLLKYYSLNEKYRSLTATSIYESIDIIKRLVSHRHLHRKLLFDFARAACENGVRSAAVKVYQSCIALLQDDRWNDEADDVYYEETLHIYTAAAECYLYRGQYQAARQLLNSISSNAKTAIDKAPSCILRSRVFALEGDSTAAFHALKECLVNLDVKVDDSPTFQDLDTEFKRLCQEIQSLDMENLVGRPMIEDLNLLAIGAVLVEATSAAFWSDTLTFYQMGLIMVNAYLSIGSFPQCGMGFLDMALIAITRHNMINFADDCGNIAVELIERWKDPFTTGRGGTIYSTFVGHLQRPLQESIAQLDEALEFAIQAGDRMSTIMNFGFAGNIKFFASENLAELESFCTYGCQDIPNWQLDTPGGTMVITIRQVCRSLQGKTYTGNPQGVMSDEEHNSGNYKSWLANTVKNSDRPLMLYESIEIAPLFLYGHYKSAVALGNSCLKKINAIWSARNTRFLMLFQALSLAGSIWTQVQEQLDPVYRRTSPQLSSDVGGRSLETGLQEEMAGVVMLMKYFKKKIEQWQAVTDVNYLAWSKLLAAQIAEMEDDHTGALRLYEEALDHAAAHNFTFEEALGNKLLGDHLLRIGSRRLAKTALREAVALYRRLGATGVASHIETTYHFIMRDTSHISLTADIGVQTDLDETLGTMQHHIVDFVHDESQIPEPFIENRGDRIGMWQDSSALAAAGGDPALHMLDLTSILESSQVISSVLQVDQLLQTMCEIILQNCKGVASLAAIVVEEDREVGWVIAASGDPDNGAEAHSPPRPIGETSMIAENVVNYCTHFREAVFLPDLIQDQRFSNVSQTWIARNPTSKSVIALPISHGDDDKPLLGVLYLEGQVNAFTAHNLEILQLLVNQIGISYSNALTLKEVERVSALNKSMVDVQKKALSEAIAAEADANIAKAEALRSAQLAEEAVKAKTIFLANISHELRTPLNGVIGNSELLLDSQLPQQQAEMADSIRVSADLLLSLINDILDFSKIEAHKMQLHVTAFNANEMVREIVRSIPTDIRNKKKKDVRILQDVNLPRTLVYGDPVRLHQILGNLVSNSLKFTEKGSVTIGAKIVWETEAAVRLTFWAKDTGIGIPPQQLHKLFKPFSQADASTARKYGGSGLGLSICKLLVESMGGTIKLDSTENVGTTVEFSVTLSKAKIEASPDDKQADFINARTVTAEEQSTAGYIELSNVPNSQLRVCIAEDNPINQKIALQFLQKLNFKDVGAYDNGLEAVEGIRKKAKEGLPYHMILMDVQMPVLDGYEATKLLRADPSDAVRGILVIALTASAVQGDREKCLASGMNDYLAKPVRLALLKKKFGQYMRLD